MELKELEQQLREATLDPNKAIEVAGELAINFLGKAHDKEDNLRVDVAREKVKLKEESPKMSIKEVETRVEATDLFRDYLKAKHATERIEEFIRIAKSHARIAGGY